MGSSGINAGVHGEEKLDNEWDWFTMCGLRCCVSWNWMDCGDGKQRNTFYRAWYQGFEGRSEETIDAKGCIQKCKEIYRNCYKKMLNLQDHVKVSFDLHLDSGNFIDFIF